MSKKFLGDACAYIPGVNGEKNKYLRIGSALQDGDGRLSIKIDTLPNSGSGWGGWINVFPRVEKDPKKAARQKEVDKFIDDNQDDIPF